jgi:hypothetical protein
MSISPEQLNEIQRQLTDYFNSHPAISVKPLKGNPPEQYEITYNISGYSKTGTGAPSLTTNHIIELTVPFGFPHFPPSCKPKSDIFHPDFDPAAICLGDFWQQHRQIPDLIVFIGKLINGESFTSTNAFNEQAAIWYQEHSDAFPIAEINWGDRQSDSISTPKEIKAQIDALDDDDLSPDFSFLSMDGSIQDEEPSPIASLPKIESPPEMDLGFLQLLASQKKFYELRQTLGKSSNLSDQVENISRRAKEEIKKAEELYKEAKKAENAGNLKNASRLYEQVGAITSDYPNLEAVKRRIIQSLALLDESADDDTSDIEKLLSSFQQEGSAHTSDQPQKKAGKRDGQFTPPSEEGPPGAEERVRSKVTYQIVDNSFLNKLTLYVLAGTLCIAFAGFGFYYFISMHRFDGANAAFKQCSTYSENEQFDDAKASCDSALDSLVGIQYFQQKRVEELQHAINAILLSERFNQGLAGNILVDGKYVHKKAAATLITINQMMKDAEAFFSQENWVKAEEQFTKILAITGKNTLIPSTAVEEIKSKLSFTRFSISFHSANTLLANHKWQDAASELKKAKVQLEKLPEKDRQKYSAELNSALAKLNFEEFRKQGDDFFSKADWLNAISLYKSVLPTGEESGVASQETLDALKENISRAELYASIDKGNKAFASEAWDEAIQEYNKAGSILTASQVIIKLADSQLTRRKIDRIILQTTLIRDRQAAKIQQEDKKDFVAARNTYRQIVANITNSGFASEDEFLETKKASIANIHTLDEKIFLSEKEQHLKDNFRTLFVANYPTAIPEKLNNPTITYVKERDGKMIFKMQCTETGRGRPSTLVMFYAYDKAGNRWDFFSEQH